MNQFDIIGTYCSRCLNVSCICKFFNENENEDIKTNKNMKLKTCDTMMIYDIVNHMREKGLPDETAGYLRFLLEDNIPMHIKIQDKLYSVSWRYWHTYVMAVASCCGCCNDETLGEVERARDELLKHATKLQDNALDY